MKTAWALTAMALFIGASAATAETSPDGREFSRLYDCTRKLHDAGRAYDMNHELAFLEDDLFYILDRHRPALYLFTPYFAGSADLSQIITKEVQSTLAANPVNKEHPFPFTPCCQGGFSYNIRIPYASDNPSKQRGYYYMTLADPGAVMYDEAVWGADHKMHAVRHDAPVMKPATTDLRVTGLTRFLPGVPQAEPDFTHYQPTPAKNGVTITSVTGQTDKAVAYRPLSVEARLWDRTAPGNFSPAAKDELLSAIRKGLADAPKFHAVGQKSDCWGHAGCDYTYTEEEVAQEHALQNNAVKACKAAADEFRLDIFPAPH